MIMNGIDELERARLELLSALDAAKTQAERNRLGQFATPPTLAREIVEVVASFLPAGCVIRFLEPGFGTGTFHSALRSLGHPNRIGAAVGYEIDRHYGVESQNLWSRTKLELHLSDFTEATSPSQ
jgi:hypothetical protein